VSGTIPNLKQAVPFFRVTDIAKSLTFYTAGLGFEVKMDWQPNGKIEWCWLEREGVALMLQEYREKIQSTIPRGEGVSICFMCRDALALYQEFQQRGIHPAEPFVGNKLWVVCLKDPDGYRLDFESSTDVAEETTYTEWLKGR